jgi:hypothetical protein
MQIGGVITAQFQHRGTIARGDEDSIVMIMGISFCICMKFINIFKG